jgi:hypothetical protein
MATAQRNSREQKHCRNTPRHSTRSTADALTVLPCLRAHSWLSSFDPSNATEFYNKAAITVMGDVIGNHSTVERTACNQEL